MNRNQYLILGGVSLCFIVIGLHCVWPYVIGLLAIVGAVQLYRLWRRPPPPSFNV